MKDVVCSHCGYNWRYKGSMKYVSCPNCLMKTQAQKKEEGSHEKKI